jgi:hypothetical protein
MMSLEARGDCFPSFERIYDTGMQAEQQNTVMMGKYSLSSTVQSFVCHQLGLELELYCAPCKIEIDQRSD